MTDGDIDYSTFSRAQLEEALTRIDRNRYPRNYQSLVEEFRTRPAVPQAARQPRDMRTSVTILGWYQIVATVVVFYYTLPWRFDLSGLRLFPLSTLVVLSASALLMLTLLVTTAISGVLTVRGHRLGPRLSVFTFGAQVLSVTVPGFSYQYAPLFALHVFWSSAAFGIRALGHDIRVSFSGSHPVYVAVDVIALSALAILVRSTRGGLPANNRWRGL